MGSGADAPGGEHHVAGSIQSLSGTHHDGAAWPASHPPHRADVSGASRSSRRRAIGHAPSDVFEITVQVVVDAGSWVLRNETPASHPSNMTTSLDASSQKPRP
jgi:hypothetical protein